MLITTLNKISIMFGYCINNEYGFDTETEVNVLTEMYYLQLIIISIASNSLGKTLIHMN